MGDRRPGWEGEYTDIICYTNINTRVVFSFITPEIWIKFLKILDGMCL